MKALKIPNQQDTKKVLIFRRSFEIRITMYWIVCVCVCVCVNYPILISYLHLFFSPSPSNPDIQPFAMLGRGLQDYKDENRLAVFKVLGMTNVNDGVSIFNSLGVKAEGVHLKTG